MKKEKRFIFSAQNGSIIIIDKTTGVNYLCVNGSGVSPLYNPDGTLIVTPPEELETL